MTDRPSHARARAHESTDIADAIAAARTLVAAMTADIDKPEVSAAWDACRLALRKVPVGLDLVPGWDGTIPPEGPDDWTEAQRVVRLLLAHDRGVFKGSHQALVERAQRWLAKAAAGQLTDLSLRQWLEHDALCPAFAEPTDACSCGLAEAVRHAEAGTDQAETLYGLALDLAGDLSDLMEHSDGVYGLHQNGDPAPWGELTRGGRFEDWLSSFDRLRDHLEPGGRCRVCGCTDDNACGAEFGTPCSWTDETRTLCDAPSCLAAAAREANDPGVAGKTLRDALLIAAEDTFTAQPPGFCGTCGASPLDRYVNPPADRIGKPGGFCPTCHAGNYGGPSEKRRLAPGYAPDAGGRPVHVGGVRRPLCEGLEEEESRDGLFPGDPGYQDALPASAPRE